MRQITDAPDTNQHAVIDSKNESAILPVATALRFQREEFAMTEAIEWTPEYSVGVELFDQQHQGLMKMINRLRAHPEAETASETISDILCEMTRYASEHFKEEEELMKKHGYPELEAHRREHLDFRIKVIDLCGGAMRQADTVPVALLEYLQTWWVTHIQDCDKKYKGFFQDLGVS